MQIIPITTPVLQEGDDLAAILRSRAEFRTGDIVVVSSKAVATVEGASLDLRKYKPTKEARDLAGKTGHRSAQFIQAVLEETERLHGHITGTCPGALLTEVKPDGLPRGTILTANAGLDESNVPEDFAVGWPVEPVSSVKELQSRLSAPTPQPPFPSGGEGEWRVRKGFGDDRYPSKTIIDRARNLRLNMTKTEETLWHLLRHHKLGVHFRRQRPVESFILDFYCEDKRLGIEIDGGIHEKQKEYDEQRQEMLEVRGIRILKFSSKEVEQHPEKVIARIKESLVSTPLPHRGRGRGGGVEGGNSLGIILSDSNCRPRRLGVAAFALVCAGVEPLRSEAGKEDLFGKKLRITTEAIADQLATAANFVMGNAGQSVPAAIIRDHGLPPSDFCGWVPGIEPEEDLFRGVI